MRKNRGLWITLIAFIFLALLFLTHAYDNHVDSKKRLDIKGQPTLGNQNALAQVVIFEEPKCPACKKFTLKVFPKIKEEFIQKNLISYTIIPVSFLPNSMPAAISWLCVFEHNRDEPNHNLQAFQFIDEMYSKQPPENQDWANQEYLGKLAGNIGIEANFLEKCLKSESFRKQIEKNTEYGTKLMNGQLGTPALFINGVLIEDLSYGNIQKKINEALVRKEKSGGLK